MYSNSEDIAVAEQQQNPTSDFLKSPGEMARLIRAFDWSETPIGPPETWSQSLRTMTGIMLANSFPMLLWWGPDYISIYNDAYIPILGLKHPWGLALPLRECWSEIWDVLKPLIDTPFRGGPSTWIEDFELEINRSGSPEETHFTVAYSPVPDETVPGGIGGVLATVHEITDKVVGARRTAILRDLNAISEARSPEQACQKVAEILERSPRDVPFALFYLAEPDSSEVRLVASAGVTAGSSAAPAVVDLSESESARCWPLGLAQKTKEVHVIPCLTDCCSGVLTSLGVDPARAAAIFPLRSGAGQQIAGFFVAGLSSRLRFDDAYRNFLHFAGAHTASAIANARAWDEERRRAEALAEIDAAKTAFFSNISHEFRTPLTLMLGAVDSLLTDSGRTGETREQLETARRNALRLLRLVNSLLDFSRIEAGRARARYQPADLAALTRELASSFRSVINAAGLRFDVNCSALSEPVYVDVEMWEKIVLNLLSNAFKFTFAGSVTIVLNEENGHAVLTVTDTGTGIPEAELDRIFERFHRVEGARGRSFEGTGIGLALIQELVKLHGGAIGVASRVGEGSTFRVTLPFGAAHLSPDRIHRTGFEAGRGTAAAEAYTGEAQAWIAREYPAGPAADASGSPPPARPRLLIADDNADMREFVGHILGGAYDVVPVANGADALREARRSKPDLIVTDVMMPELDGFGLLREVRGNADLREVPVILLSARAGEDARVEGISAGADNYLTKPFSARELLALVEGALALRRTRLEAQKAIAESGKRFRAFVTATSDVVFRMAPAWDEMWILEGRNFIAGTTDHSRDWIEKYIHPDDRARVLDAVRNAIRTRSAFELEHRVIRLDGSPGWTFTRAVPIVNDTGDLVEWLGAARDVTKRKDAEQALATANAALERSNLDLQQFARSASHDLQEPWRIVALYSELLSREFGSLLSPPGEQYLAFIVEGAQRMDHLLSGLRTYTRVSMETEIPAEPVDSETSLDEALANLATAIGESGAVVTREPLPRVKVKSFEMEQLFRNLIGNAIRYRGADAPRIHIAAVTRDSEYVFSVRDNGMGIEPQYHEQIFTIFKRLHTVANYPGTGMGLAICHRIVERSGGAIRVESEPGTGSTFFFTIPISKD